MLYYPAYFINNDKAYYLAQQDGLFVQKVWTRQFIPWEEVCLFYSLNATPVSLEELINPQKFARYEIASRSKRIILWVIPHNNVAKYADDPQTYGGRMADILYTIASRSGVELREKRGKDKRAVKTAPER